MNKIVLNIQDAYYQSHRDYHNYKDWEQEQWDRVEKAEQEASLEIDALQAELEKCKQMLAVAEVAIDSALLEASWPLVRHKLAVAKNKLDDMREQALAKIEEMKS